MEVAAADADADAADAAAEAEGEAAGAASYQRTHDKVNWPVQHLLSYILIMFFVFQNSIRFFLSLSLSLSLSITS